MSKTKFIKIQEPNISNNILLIRLTYSDSVRKYFLSNLLHVTYDRDVSNVSKSILTIPAISNVITVAWAIGADVHVKELDKTYSESLEKVKSVMKRFYPKLSFSTNVNIERVVSNSFSNKGMGLLFSGGIDSLTSYIKHKDKKPFLMMVKGADIPFNEEKVWGKIKDKYEKFADKERIKICFINANMRQFINERRLNVEFGRHLTNLSWWAGFSHGMSLIGLCAPLTAIENIATILIASSDWQELALERALYPWGSNPLIDNKISWADVKVVHDGFELSRQKKIKMLSSWIKYSKYYPFMRVCYSQFHGFNCGKCEKCLRTICGLILEGIDPNKCGFKVDKNFFDIFKQRLIKGKFTVDEGEVFMWRDIQRHIPNSLSHNLYDSRKFFKWFKNFDISKSAKRRSIKVYSSLCLYWIYYKLPICIQSAIYNICCLASTPYRKLFLKWRKLSHAEND